MTQALAAPARLAETATDEALVAAARQRPDDFAALYARYMPRVYRYVAARTGNREDAADITQLVFARAFASLPKYRPDRAPFVAWLFRIARNAVTDSHRRRRATVSWDGLPDAVSTIESGNPELVAERREQLTHLRAVLEQIDSTKRELLVLRYAGGLSSKEIATVVGKSESAVKKQLARTIARLKENYRDELR
jgi:RNA polymerase sigma-70 factor (ECF subfamily)